MWRGRNGNVVYKEHLSTAGDNFECYCLRILLNVIRGPTDFQDLKKVGGQEFATFRRLCEKMGLLDDGNHWDATTEDAVQCKLQAGRASKRAIFRIDMLLRFIQSSSTMTQAKTALSEDIMHRFERMDQVNEDSNKP